MEMVDPRTGAPKTSSVNKMQALPTYTAKLDSLILSDFSQLRVAMTMLTSASPVFQRY